MRFDLLRDSPDWSWETFDGLSWAFAECVSDKECAEGISDADIPPEVAEFFRRRTRTSE